MTRIALLAALLSIPAVSQGPSPVPAPGADAGLARVKVVYLMPMASGLDQYLANHLTAKKVFQVTTDPKQADALISDQIGAGFEKRYEQIYPPPPPPKEEEVKEADKDKDKESEKDKETQEAPALDLKPAKEYRLSSNVWGRGKGNVYLIDVRTRQVLWSTYRRPKSFDASEMDSTAAKIVSRLQQDLKGAK